MFNQKNVTAINTENLNFTAIDFETANRYRRSACSIGMVKVENGKIVDEFYSFIKPTPNIFEPKNIDIHGITPEMCEGAPTFEELWPTIKPWIDRQISVAHNASFESSVLSHLFNELCLNNRIKDLLCTLYLSKVYFNKHGQHKLPYVFYSAFGKTLNHHNPLDDAKACAEITLHVVKNWQPQCFEKMVVAIYKTPIKYRTGKIDIPLSKLQPDEGFEGNTQFNGMNFTFTGDLGAFSREEAAQYVVNRGGKVNESVTKATTHLVIRHYSLGYGKDYKSSKLKKAQEMIAKGAKIEILSTNDFLFLTQTKGVLTIDEFEAAKKILVA